MAKPRYTPMGGPFTKVHEQFIHDADLDWDSLDPSRYAPSVVTAGRRAFVLRALDEQRSLAAFAELLSDLAASGAPIDLIGALTRVVRDEARHVDVCRRVVDRLGGWPAKAPEPRWVRANPKTPLHLRVLMSMVGSMCIGETISVHMIAGVRRHASDPLIAAVLTQLLADESFHSRVGWWWLEQHELTDDERRFLAGWLPRVFASIERGARPSEAQIAGDKPFVASPFGNMSRHERAAAFDRAMDETILPGLAAAGIDATRAFEAREELAA